MVVKNTSQIGKELRISRFLNPKSQRCVMVAYAHGVLLGPIPGMTTNDEIKKQNETLRGADAILMPMGFLPACQSYICTFFGDIWRKSMGNTPVAADF